LDNGGGRGLDCRHAGPHIGVRTPHVAERRQATGGAWQGEFDPLLAGSSSPRHVIALYASAAAARIIKVRIMLLAYYLRVGTSRQCISVAGAQTRVPLHACLHERRCHAYFERVAPLHPSAADCALMTQAHCLARREKLNPGTKLATARNAWTDELKEQLRTARHSEPGAAWATVVNSNERLRSIGLVSHSSAKQQVDPSRYPSCTIIHLMSYRKYIGKWEETKKQILAEQVRARRLAF
jgi:hypothetical protein